MIDQEIKIAPVNLETKSVPTEKTATSQPNFIQTFSTLLIDQLNTQDVNVLLQTQRQMFEQFFLYFLNFDLIINSKAFRNLMPQTRV